MDNMKISGDSRQVFGLRGELIGGRGRRVEEFIDPFGNRSWRTTFDEVLFHETNMVPIGAYSFIFSKLFNIAMDDPTRNNLKVGSLNDDNQLRIGVSPKNYSSWFYNAETGSSGNVPPVSGVNISANEAIFGFMIGDGGSREDNITAIAPDYKRRTLYHPIPFRVTDAPEKVWANKYFGRFTDLQQTTSFYVKRFEMTNVYPHIVHAWVSDSDQDFQPVDESVFSSTSSTPIESYVEMFLKIDSGDGLEYFNRTNTTPRINEIGLVSGWYNSQLNDFENIRLITHFTRSSIVIAENDYIEIIYRLYAR